MVTGETPERTWTVAQLADEYHLSRSHIYTAIRRGDLVAYRLAGLERGMFVYDSDFQKYLGEKGVRVENADR